MAPRALSGVLLVALSACGSAKEQRLELPIAGHDVNLTCWKLTLPVDADGGFDGVAAEVKRPGFETKPWFEERVDGVVFTAPVNGATTKGSKYPRCELRELDDDGSLAAWTVAKGGWLQATLSVDEVPKTKRGEPGALVIGQIHGPQDELCRLYFRDGKLTYSNDKSGADEKERSFELKATNGNTTEIGLGEKFEYTIEVSRLGDLTVRVVHKGVPYEAVERIAKFWEEKPLYFKAGVYVQVGRDGSGRGRASFSELSVSH